MCNLKLDEVKDLINTLGGPILIAFYRSSDTITETFKEVINYIKSGENKKYNWISLDASYMSELCAYLRILETPCVVLFMDGEVKYTFCSYVDIGYIEMTTNIITGSNRGDGYVRWSGTNDDEYTDEEEEIEIAF